MKRRIVLLVLGLTGCNFDMGECYVRGHGTEGAGGGIITPTGGVGGFGYVPLQPQNHTGYDEDPCSGGSQLAECTVTWKAGSIQCKNWGETGACTSLYQGDHASLDEAKERCEYRQRGAPPLGSAVVRLVLVGEWREWGLQGALQAEL
jgi:hypothetical protein